MTRGAERLIDLAAGGEPLLLFGASTARRRAPCPACPATRAARARRLRADRARRRPSRATSASAGSRESGIAVTAALVSRRPAVRGNAGAPPGPPAPAARSRSRAATAPRARSTAAASTARHRRSEQGCLRAAHHGRTLPRRPRRSAPRARTHPASDHPARHGRSSPRHGDRPRSPAACPPSPRAAREQRQVRFRRTPLSAASTVIGSSPCRSSMPASAVSRTPRGSSPSVAATCCRTAQSGSFCELDARRPEEDDRVRTSHRSDRRTAAARTSREGSPRPRVTSVRVEAVESVERPQRVQSRRVVGRGAAASSTRERRTRLRVRRGAAAPCRATSHSGARGRSTSRGRRLPRQRRPSARAASSRARFDRCARGRAGPRASARGSDRAGTP